MNVIRTLVSYGLYSHPNRLQYYRQPFSPRRFSSEIKTPSSTGKRALYAGSFDPPSRGHLDIIRRASSVCDTLVVGVAINPEKKHVFSLEERVAFMKRITSDIKGVEIQSFDGLVVDFAKKHKIDFLLRGLRAFSDFESEFRMALVNRQLTGIETVFLMSDANFAHISSTLIRQLAKLGKSLPGFLPAEIEKEVLERLLPK